MLIYIALLGLMSGSFVNAYVWRIHKQSSGAISSTFRKKLSVVQGRSMCPICKHELASKDLVPVFSWLYLRGRCRYCHKPISVQYPLVELSTMLLFVASYLFWPYELSSAGVVLLITWLVALVFFMALAVYDLKWMLLPNRMVFPLVGVGVVHALIATSQAYSPSFVIQIAGAILIAWGIFYVLYQLSKGQWIGGGDVKLGIALGLFLLNPWHAAVMLFIASVAGCVVALASLVARRASLATKIPFGPYLILATVVVKLFGEVIIGAYLSLVIA